MCDDNEQNSDTGTDDGYELPYIQDDDIGYIEKGLDPDDD